MAKTGMAKTSITKRWLINSLGSILLVLIILEIVFAYAVHNTFYAMVDQELSTQATLCATQLSAYAASAPEDGEGNWTYYSNARRMVETFDARDRFELMLVDGTGRVAVTSSGFSTDLTFAGSDIRPFEAHELHLETDPDVMAMFVASPREGLEDFAGMVLMVSLQEVNHQILTMIALITLVGIAIIFFVVFSSSYFINSIVIPVGEVGKAARQIASGDFNTRLVKKHNDEIGELCDTINHMADELGESERLKNEFISTISHELRTPMTAIRGWGETLIDDQVAADPALIKKGIGVILSETERLSQMVEELLDFSRIQSGRLSIVLERVDLLAELDEVVLMFTERTKKEGKELHFSYPGALPPVAGDPARLKQVFINIIDNAIKYSDAGDRIDVSAHRTGGNILVKVADTGIGIPAADLPHIKERFYKANQTRRGSGIGLSVVDEIVRMHGGTFDIASTEGKGTTVTVSLPVYDPKRTGLITQKTTKE